MIIRATLSQQESDLVIYAVLIQLEALRDILNKDIHTDLPSYLFNLGISEEAFIKEVKITRTNFEQVLGNPEIIFGLHDDNLAVIKTILIHINKSEYSDAKANLWRKFNTQERVKNYYSLN